MAKTVFREDESNGDYLLGEVIGEELVLDFGNARGLQFSIHLPVKAVAELLVNELEAKEKKPTGARRG